MLPQFSDEKFISGLLITYLPQRNKRSEQFLISPHLCSSSLPELGLHRVLLAYVLPCVHLKKTLLFLVLTQPYMYTPWWVGLPTAPHAHWVRCICPATILSALYDGPALSSGRIVKLEKFYFRAFSHTPLSLLSATLCCPAIPQPRTTGIPSSYLLETCLHSKLPALFPGPLAVLAAYWQWALMSVPSAHVNSLCWS